MVHGPKEGMEGEEAMGYKQVGGWKVDVASIIKQ